MEKRIYKLRKENQNYEMASGGVLNDLHNHFSNLTNKKGTALSPSTLKSYISKLNRVAIMTTNKPFENDTFLYNADNVINHIERSNLKSKKDYLSAIAKYLRAKDVDADILAKYGKAMAKEKADEMKMRGDNKSKPTDVKKTDGKSLADIQKQINEYSIKTDGKIDANKLINKLLVSFYFMNFDSNNLPIFIPRNNLPDIKIVSLNRTKKPLSNEYNYLVIDSNGKPTKIIMKNYKTKANYGTQSFSISPVLTSLLKDYITQFNKKPGEYLFTDKNGLPFKNTTFSGIIERAMEDVIGNKIGIDLARQIVISNVYNNNGIMSINQKNEIARAFLHSSNVANEYVRPDLIPEKDK